MLHARGSRRSGCSTVGKGTVDEKRSVRSNVDDALVQAVIAAIADETVQVRGIIVVVASANGVLSAAADDVASLVLVGGLVMITVLVGIVVHVGAVQPETGPEGESTSDEDEGKDAGTTSTTSPVRSGSTTAVVSTSTIGRRRARTSL